MALHWPPSTTPLQPFFDFCVQSYSASHLYLSHIMYSFCHSNPWIKLLFWFINSSSISSTLHSPCSFPLPLSSQILFIINFLGNLFDALTSSIHLHYPLHLVNAQPLTTHHSNHFNALCSSSLNLCFPFTHCWMHLFTFSHHLQCHHLHSYSTIAPLSLLSFYTLTPLIVSFFTNAPNPKA